MGVLRIMRVSTLCWIFLLLSSTSKCGSSNSSEVSVKFLRAPHAFSHLNSATFAFEALDSGSGSSCTNCSFTCKLDDGVTSVCKARRVIYSSLRDGSHSFKVCANGPQGLGCASYNWTVDTVAPTAYVTASTSFTSALNVSVDITFSEPCIGGGLGCISVNACNLLVYGAGQVIPSSFTVLQPNLKYSLLISLSSTVQYGRAILVMDKNFCTDMAGNSFTRTPNSSFYVHFDRRWDYVNLRTRVPEMLLQLNSETRTVLATNDYNKLKVFVYFSVPVLNSSAEIIEHLSINQGSLIPTRGKTRGNRRFGFLITNVSSNTIISVSFNSTSIISRQGIPVAPVAPVTFLYDPMRPSVNLSTYSTRTQEHNVQILIKFVKPVFGFNSSCILSTGGSLRSFREISRSIYIVELQTDDNVISINVPENVTHDIAGNKNLASSVLQVRHYSSPLISVVISTFATASFVLTSLVAGLLTISTASLQYFGAFSRSSSFLTVDPARRLFRIICYIQIFALSKWLSVKLPIEFYEFAKNLQWTIPYLLVPWETKNMHLLLVGASPFGSPNNPFVSKVPAQIPIMKLIDNSSNSALVYGSPLTSSEYQLYFENPNVQPKAEFISDSHHPSGWTDFSRSMFWLVVIFGGLIILHAFLLLILKFRKRNSEKPKKYGALTFPRFEIFLLFLALPGICKASIALLRGSSSGMVVGILLLVFVSFVLLALFLFLSVGITLGKLLQYKEVHQEGQKFHWYQELVRVTLGPGKRGQWTWKELPNSVRLTIFGPLFEDLRGPPKYMLSQIAGGHPQCQGDRIIASEDETEDAEAPFIQKLFGILRIYYVLLESIRRVSFGILAGVYNKTESSKTPTTIILSISAFQLFFVVLKKPFIKKKVQLVEIISLSCEVALFATCLALSSKDFSLGTETKFGIFLLILFLLGFVAHIMNEWYALYRQTRMLDPDEKSFLRGLKIASIGFLLYFIPQRCIKSLEGRFPKNHGGGNEETRDVTFSDERFKNLGGRSSGSTDKPWLKQLRELAKASFGKEGSPNDPSTSTARWSGIWGNKRSGSSSMNSSSDFKSKPSGLYQDLEAIFASK